MRIVRDNVILWRNEAAYPHGSVSFIEKSGKTDWAAMLINIESAAAVNRSYGRMHVQ